GVGVLAIRFDKQECEKLLAFFYADLFVEPLAGNIITYYLVAHVLSVRREPDFFGFLWAVPDCPHSDQERDQETKEQERDRPCRAPIRGTDRRWLRGRRCGRLHQRRDEIS